MHGQPVTALTTVDGRVHRGAHVDDDRVVARPTADGVGTVQVAGRQEVRTAVALEVVAAPGAGEVVIALAASHDVMVEWSACAQPLDAAVLAA